MINRLNLIIMLKKLYDYCIAKSYDFIMSPSERQFLGQHRSRLLNTVEGLVLEIGAGTGANFPFYNANVQLIACEPAPNMAAKAQARLDSNIYSADIQFVPSAYEDLPQKLKDFPVGRFDVIVCTLVLCSVPDIEHALTQFRSWLKPNGRLYVLEHICAKQKWACQMQHAINPVWKKLAQGCNLNRSTDLLIKTHGFMPVWESYFVRGVRFYEAELRLG